MTKIVYRQVSAPLDPPHKSPCPPRAKIEMRKPQSGAKFSVQIPGGARRMVMTKIDSRIIMNVCILEKMTLMLSIIKIIHQLKTVRLVFTEQY